MNHWKHVSEELKFSAEKMQKRNLFESEHMFCDVYGLEPGQSQKAHVHVEADKMYYVIEGEALFHVAGKEQVLRTGSVVYAPAGSEHGVTNTGEKRLALLVVMTPNVKFRRV